MALTITLLPYNFIDFKMITDISASFLSSTLIMHRAMNFHNMMGKYFFPSGFYLNVIC